MHNMNLTFQAYFKVKEMELVLLYIKDDSIRITDPSDLPKEVDEWRQIAHRRSKILIGRRNLWSNRP